LGGIDLAVFLLWLNKWKNSIIKLCFGCYSVFILSENE